MTVAQEVQGWRAWPKVYSFPKHDPMYDVLQCPHDEALHCQVWGYTEGRFRVAFFRTVDGIGQRILDTRQSWPDFIRVAGWLTAQQHVDTPYAAIAAEFAARAAMVPYNDQRRTAAVVTAALIAHHNNRLLFQQVMNGRLR